MNINAGGIVSYHVCLVDFSMYRKGKQTFTTNHIAYMILVLKKFYAFVMLTIFISFMIHSHSHIKAKTAGFSCDGVFKLTF